MGAPEQFHPLQDAAAVVSRALLAGLAPLPALDVAAWADAHRYLPSKGAAEPGRWRTDRVPYLRPVMDWLSGTHPATRVVLMAAAQTGKTECGLNWVGAFIGTQRGPMLCVQPTLDMAERWSKQRLAPMIDEAPQLRARVAPARSRDSGNTVLLKEFPGGLVIAAGANSATGLRSMPARYVFLDEVDAYPPEIDGEGDPVSLAEARTATFGRRRKVFLCSTPTTERRSRIWREYQASTQGEWHVPCPECGHYQALEWERLDWPAGEPHKARYLCAADGCGALIDHAAKGAMLSAGRLVERHPERAVPGLAVSGLYSPPGLGLTWAELAAEWEAVQADPFASRTFWNVRLGRVTSDPLQRLDWDEIKSRAEDYPLRTAPPGCLLLTAGVDVQGDRLAVQILGFGYAGGAVVTWTLDNIELPGDPLRGDVWQALDALRAEPIHNARGAPLRITLTAVDSGYLTEQVLAYVRPRQRQGVIACKGASTTGRPVIAGRPSRVDVTVRGQTIRHGAEIWVIGADTAKALLFARLEADRAHALAHDRLVRFSRDLDDAYFSQLTAEEYDPARRRWVKVRPRNEALDTWVLATAATYHPSLRLHTWRPHQWERLQQTVEPDADLFTAPARAAAAAPAPDPAPAPPAEAPAPRPATYMDTLIAARRSRRHE